jgi:hypothetical protein
MVLHPHPRWSFVIARNVRVFAEDGRELGQRDDALPVGLLLPVTPPVVNVELDALVDRRLAFDIGADTTGSSVTFSGIAVING